MRLLIQLRPAAELVAAVADPRVTVRSSDILGESGGLVLDDSFAPIVVPGPVPSESDRPTYSSAPEHATVLVRGEIPDGDIAAGIRLLNQSPTITGVFADPVIETCLTCGGDPAVGNWHDIESRLHVDQLAAAGLSGAAVALAIVDTGINAAFVGKVRGTPPIIDKARSWNPSGVTGTAGEFPVAHGSMCAFDVLIAAPQATLLDIPVMQSTRQGGTVMDGLLSDAVAAYAQLRTVLSDQPESTRALVVSNSWGSFSPQWDFPVGNPGNYSDNPSHPFNIIVGSLEAAGADIIFAAGNCGRDCPDARCAYKTQPIGGANSHPSVLSIGGVDDTGTRVGYSSQGPGRLSAQKPDICSYTHFLGSTAFGAGEPDTGTSAACPVSAGVIAAIRTEWSATALPPAQLRALLRSTATDRGTLGFDNDYGFGVIDTAALLTELRRTVPHA
ncbi:MAG: peptidase in kexin sedolisin [Nocardia sp.]|uniref:S8 family serine peptidase n=1 Tax=Nocardia sp. TaxID=1821 RepID=UPI002631A951|nr:S8 family serine peptidase [Nocardia sp.]MCU1644234.1 peptidase in kexin sedolisin [Nocardia sp.]